MKYAIGLDYGTNSVRCVIVDTANGQELGTCVYEYETGQAGILLDPADHNVARQNPADYLKGAEITVAGAIVQAKKAEPAFNPKDIVGIGVDTTGSTPLPVDRNGTPLAMLDAFKSNRTPRRGCGRTTRAMPRPPRSPGLRRRERPQYLAKCGGTYSSEWFFSKILHCLRADPKVFDAAYTWVEHADWLPAVLTGTDHPDKIRRCRCAAGHKAMFSDSWGGYPDAEFLVGSRSEARAAAKTLATDLRRGPAGGQTDGCLGRQARPARGDSRGGGRVRRAPGRRGLRDQGRRAGQDHRHQHLRHGGLAQQCEPAGHPGHLRHRRRLDPAGLLRPGGGPVGGGRYLQLVRQLSPAGRQGERFPCGPDRKGRQTASRANPDCSPSTGTTATARSWSISGSRVCWWARRCTRGPRKSTGR